MIGALNGARVPLTTVRGRVYRDYSTTLGRHACRCLVDRDLETAVATRFDCESATATDRAPVRWAAAFREWLSTGGTRQW